MALSPADLKDQAKIKQGFSVSADEYKDSLRELVSLITNMQQYRAARVCAAHNNTPYSGPISLGNLSTFLATIPACSCNAQAQTVCDCLSRTATPTCLCNIQTYCDCLSRTATDACYCQVRTQSCACVLIAYDENWYCECLSRTGGDSCTCNARISTCDCVGRTGVNPCICNGRCSCNQVETF